MLNKIFFFKKIKKTGVFEWLLVRCSATLIFLYTFYLLWFIFDTNILTYEVWHAFFSKKITKIFNLITLCSILIHSWIGMSHILTDYIKNLLLKRFFNLTITIIFFIYFLCGMSVIWST